MSKFSQLAARDKRAAYTHIADTRRRQKQNNRRRRKNRGRYR